jgi:hypothetical protein
MSFDIFSWYCSIYSGVAQSISEIQEFTSKAGKALIKCEAVIVDRSNASIKVSTLAKIQSTHWVNVRKGLLLSAFLNV